MFDNGASGKTKSLDQLQGYISNLRSWLRESNWFNWVLIFFLTGFIVAWSTRVHRDFFYFFVFFPFIIAQTRQGWRAIFSSKIILSLIIFLSYLLLSITWSTLPVTTEIIYDYFRYSVLIIVFVAAIAYTTSIDSKNWIRQLHNVIVPISVLVCIYSLFAFYSENNFPTQRLSNLIFYRSNPNDNIFYLIIALISINIIVYKRIKSDIYLGWFGISFSTVFIILTQSRTLFLGLIVGIACNLACFRYWKVLLSLILLSTLFVFAIETWDIGIEGFVQRGDSYRFDIWSLALDRIFDSPLFGEGIYTNKFFYVAGTYHCMHNVFFLISLIGGVVGLGLFLVVIFFATYHAIRGVIANRTTSCLYLSLLLTGILVSNTAGVSASDIIANVGSYYWLSIWFPLGLLAGQEISD